MSNRIAQLPGSSLLVTPNPSRCRTRRQSFRCAWHGLRETWCTQPNLRIHLYVGTVVIGLGVWAHLPLLEWLWVSFAIGLVIFTELMNTAIEQTVDLVVGLRPACAAERNDAAGRPDPLARSVKDVAAGCVLVATILAVVIESFVFIPRLLRG